MVVKPIFGGEGRGITRVADPDLVDVALHRVAKGAKSITRDGVTLDAATLLEKPFSPEELLAEVRSTFDGSVVYGKDLDVY